MGVFFVFFQFLPIRVQFMCGFEYWFSSGVMLAFIGFVFNLTQSSQSGLSGVSGTDFCLYMGGWFSLSVLSAYQVVALHV